MTPGVVNEKNIHAMTYVVCLEDTHAMIVGVVHEKNRHAMTLVDPYVVCLEEHTYNDTRCGS